MNTLCAYKGEKNNKWTGCPRLFGQLGQISIKIIQLQQAPLPTNLCQNTGISTFNMSQIMILFLRRCCLFNIIMIRPHMGLSASTLDHKF